MTRRLVGLGIAGAVAATLCGALAHGDGRRARAVSAPSLTLVESRVFLVGDAGDPDPRGEPVLVALTRGLARDPERSLAVFLGDNVYPRGLPAPDHPSRSEAERRLDAQVDAVTSARARGLFVPGNHDWDRHGKDGWDAVRRQAERVSARGGPAVSFLPRDGCPGPAVYDVGERLRLVALDTQWWLHDQDKPRDGDPRSSCDADSEPEVLAKVRDVLSSAAGRQVVVVSHHPPASGGTHGGHFEWRDHVFPLRAWKGWLWLPLPGLGSAYPSLRRSGAFEQDLTAPAYAHMRDALEGVLAERPPLAWAAGHEHGLQVLRGTAVRWVLVSGAGIYGHTRAPAWLDATRFASGAAGFLTLEVGAAGAVRLAVVEVGADGGSDEVFTTLLR